MTDSHGDVSKLNFRYLLKAEHVACNLDVAWVKLMVINCSPLTLDIHLQTSFPRKTTSRQPDCVTQTSKYILQQCVLREIGKKMLTYVAI